MAKKVLLVNGSPHQNGNTKKALTIVENAIKSRGVDTFYFELGKNLIRGCVGCNACASTHRCVFNDDKCNELLENMLEADGIIIGSPVYFAGPNGALLSLLDRVFYALKDATLLKGKPVASVACCWREGGTPTLDRLNKYFTYSQMPIISSSYWNVRLDGDDGFGDRVLTQLGLNMAEEVNIR